MCMVCRSLFVLLYFFLWPLFLSVLRRFTDINFLIGIFKLFFIRNNDCLHFVNTSVHPWSFLVGSVVYLFSFRCYVAFFVLYLFFVCLVFDFDLCLVFVFCFFLRFVVLAFVFVLCLVSNVTHVSGSAFLGCLFVFSLRFTYVV